MIDLKEIFKDGIKAAYISLMPWSGIATGGIALIVLLFAFWFFALRKTDSANEKAADDARTDVILKDANVNAQAENVEKDTLTVKQAEKRSQEAVKQRTKAIANSSKIANVDYSTANKERCQTFPDSPDCK